MYICNIMYYLLLIEFRFSFFFKIEKKLELPEHRRNPKFRKIKFETIAIEKKFSC